MHIAVKTWDVVTMESIFTTEHLPDMSLELEDVKNNDGQTIRTILKERFNSQEYKQSPSPQTTKEGNLSDLQVEDGNSLCEQKSTENSEYKENWIRGKRKPDYYLPVCSEPVGHGWVATIDQKKSVERRGILHGFLPEKWNKTKCDNTYMLSLFNVISGQVIEFEFTVKGKDYSEEVYIVPMGSYQFAVVGVNDFWLYKIPLHQVPELVKKREFKSFSGNDKPSWNAGRPIVFNQRYLVRLAYLDHLQFIDCYESEDRQFKFDYMTDHTGLKLLYPCRLLLTRFGCDSVVGGIDIQLATMSSISMPGVPKGIKITKGSFGLLVYRGQENLFGGILHLSPDGIYCSSALCAEIYKWDPEKNSFVKMTDQHHSDVGLPKMKCAGFLPDSRMVVKDEPASDECRLGIYDHKNSIWTCLMSYKKKELEKVRITPEGEIQCEMADGSIRIFQIDYQMELNQRERQIAAGDTTKLSHAIAGSLPAIPSPVRDVVLGYLISSYSIFRVLPERQEIRMCEALQKGQDSTPCCVM